MRWRIRFVGWAVVLLAGWLWIGAMPALAQVEDLAPDAGPEEIRQALEEFFARRLRAELGLTDEQAEAVLPVVRQMQQESRREQRERRRLLGQLQRAYHEGASDEELLRLLRAVEELEERQFRRERERLRQLDEHLTPRQQVKFRFFARRFREELERRVREIRSRRGGRPRR